MRRTRARCDRRIRGVGNRQSHCDLGPAAVPIRIDFQRATKLAKSFPHPADSNSRRTRRQEYQFFVGRYAFTVILYFNSNLAVRGNNADGRAWAFRMTMDVCETFLHQPKDRRLHISRQAGKILRQFQVHLYSAALRESLDVPAKGRCQPGFIKKRWMEQGRKWCECPWTCRSPGR